MHPVSLFSNRILKKYSICCDFFTVGKALWFVTKKYWWDIVYRTCFVCPCSCSSERKTNFTLRIAIPIPKMPFINWAGHATILNHRDLNIFKFFLVLRLSNVALSLSQSYKIVACPAMLEFKHLMSKNTICHAE